MRPRGRFTPYVLLGVLTLGAGLGLGLGLAEAPSVPPSSSQMAVCSVPLGSELWACPASPSVRTAQRMLTTVRLPLGAKTVDYPIPPSALQGSGQLGPACTQLTDVVHFWTLPGAAATTAQEIADHVPTWLPLSGQGEAVGPGQVVYGINEGSPGTKRQLSITVARIATGRVGVRADAIVVPSNARCVRAATPVNGIVIIPDVVGLQGVNAGLLMGRMDLTVHAESSAARQGLVLAQKPVAGTRLSEGSRVTLIVSSGPPG